MSINSVGDDEYNRWKWKAKYKSRKEQRCDTS